MHLLAGPGQFEIAAHRTRHFPFKKKDKHYSYPKGFSAGERGPPAGVSRRQPGGCCAVPTTRPEVSTVGGVENPGKGASHHLPHRLGGRQRSSRARPVSQESFASEKNARIKHALKTGKRSGEKKTGRQPGSSRTEDKLPKTSSDGKKKKEKEGSPSQKNGGGGGRRGQAGISSGGSFFRRGAGQVRGGGVCKRGVLKAGEREGLGRIKCVETGEGNRKPHRLRAKCLRQSIHPQPA